MEGAPCAAARSAELEWGLILSCQPARKKDRPMSHIFRTFVLALATLTLSAALIAESTFIADAAVFPSSPK
jgi:hypothetical protein